MTRVAPSDALEAFLIAGFVVTMQWMALPLLGGWVVVLAAVLVALNRRPEWLTPEGSAALEWHPARLWPGRPSASACAIGIALCFPIAWHLAMTWRQEFGFRGDDPYHFSAARAYAVALGRVVPWLAALAVAVYVATRRAARGYGLLLMFAGLYALSFTFTPPFAVARYPATFYLIAAPFNVAAELFRWPSPAQANHLANALSVPAWLFVLRPLVVRRWPDLAVLPAAILCFFQKEVVYYFTYGVIEPWNFVLVLTAIEYVIVAPRERRWFAVLLTATACLIKETTVLLFPIVWALAGGVRRADGRLRIGVRAGLFGAAALAPFVVFYILRRHTALVHTVGLGSLASVYDAARFRQFWSLLHFQYGSSGVVALAALAAYWIAGLVLLKRRGFDLALHASLGLAALGFVVFFFHDDMSVPFTAYSRFMLNPLFLGAGIMLLATHRLLAPAGPAAIACVAALLLALHAAPLASTLALDRRPDFARNSREWFHIPVYLPIRALVGRIPADAPVRSVKIVTYGFDTSGAPNVYPDLNRRVTLIPDQQLVDRVDCRCVSDDRAVLLGIEVPALMVSDTDPHVAAALRQCQEQIRATCATTATIAHDTGAEAGVIGFGTRQTREQP